MIEEEKRKDEDKFKLCPNCNIKVPPRKMVSPFACLVPPILYLLYYYFDKKPECPICGYVWGKGDTFFEAFRRSK